MQITRRRFMEQAGVGLGALMVPLAHSRVAHATPIGSGRTLVVLFVRGGWDGLNVVVPRGDEANYLAVRTSEELGKDIALPPAPEMALDGFFELNPDMAALMPSYNSGELAIIHACGGTGQYSHFEAQDAMERAEPNNPSLVSDGWLHRTLAALQAESALEAPALALSGISLGPIKPKALVGPENGLSMTMPSLATLALTGEHNAARGSALEALYRQASQNPVGPAGAAAFDAIAATEGLADEPPAATYPSSGLADAELNAALQDAARLIKNESLGVKCVTVDFGGWDHHSAEIKKMTGVARRLAGSLAAFRLDLGSAADRTLVLVMSEFGRTAFVNGTAGTGHGWGTCMMALGGGIHGGRVLTRADSAAPGTGLVTPSGHWPGLGPGELHVSEGEERDLKSTTDYRDVFGEALERFLGLSSASVRDNVLRGYTPQFPGLFS